MASCCCVINCALTDADTPLLKAIKHTTNDDGIDYFPESKINFQLTIDHSACARAMNAHFERKMGASETTLMNCSLGSFYARCPRALLNFYLFSNSYDLYIMVLFD